MGRRSVVLVGGESSGGQQVPVIQLCHDQGPSPSEATIEMIDVLPEFGRWVQPIHELANTPFEPSAFRVACEAIAPIKKESSDERIWHFGVAPDFTLLVAVETEATGEQRSPGWTVYRPVRVLCALLSVCWWETFLRIEHATETS